MRRGRLSDNVISQYGYGSILVLGDSIAQLSFSPGGFSSELAAKYAGRLDVLNRGMAGYTSEQLLHMLEDHPQFPESSDVRLILLVIGTNDCTTSGPQHIPVAQYQANLRDIVSRLRQDYPEAALIALSPSIVDTTALTKHEIGLGLPLPLRNLRSQYNHRLYSKACIATATDLDVPVINSFELHDRAMQQGASSSDLLTDGVHYTQKGYSIISSAVLSVINDHYPQLLPSNVQTGFPLFVRYRQPSDPALDSMASWVKDLVARVEKVQDAAFVHISG